MRGATSNQMSYLSNGYDHSKMLKESYISNRFDHMNTINETTLGSPSNDLFGLKTLRCSLVSPSRQPAPSIFNMTGDIHSTNNTDISGFESPIMNIADNTDSHGFENCGYSPISEDMRPSTKLMLDLSRAKHPMMPNRNSGSSPPFSDSSLSTGSSNLDMGFFSHNMQTGRSNSPDTVGSNSSVESSPNQLVSSVLRQMTEQELANLQNLHVVRCLSNMSNASDSYNKQCLQTINMFLQSVLRNKQNMPVENDILEMEARHHRTAAVSGNAEAQFTWSGKLPKRSHKGGPYSSKVFLGGVPWDITEEMLICSFRQFGNVKVEWPGKEAISQPKGFAYIIFENDMQVKLLLESCREGVGENEGSFYYKIPSRKSKPKEVQVIPWSINDSNYSVKTIQKLDPRKTVFVGALHGMMNAEGLFHIMDDLFEGVLYAGIDTDKNKYPIGSGRVTFDNYMSYVKAVTAAFVDIKTQKFFKKVQIDPYLEDTPCSSCHVNVGPYFCRANGCFRYFCTGCWSKQHMSMSSSHKPLTRKSKHGVTNAITVSSH